MTHRAVAMIALGALAALAGCTVTAVPGELSAGDCSDGRDNDGDGPADCDDADCQALESCTRQAIAREGSQPGQIGDAYVAVPDSGPWWPLPPAPDGAPPDPVPADGATDALVEPEPPCGGRCNPDERCVSGTCVPPEAIVAELWDITRVEARVPDSIDSETNECLDTTCEDPRPSLFGCRCLPDPKVQVFVDYSPTDTMEPVLSGETAVEPDADTAVWDAPGITIKLLPESVIELRVVDVDDAGDTPIFGCSLPAMAARSDELLVCNEKVPPEGLLSRTYSITATVAPNQAAP